MKLTQVVGKKLPILKNDMTGKNSLWGKGGLLAKKKGDNTAEGGKGEKKKRGRAKT